MDTLVVSRKFWVYWVITIPLTLVTVIFWHFWINGSIYRLWGKFLERREEKRLKESVDEKRLKESVGEKRLKESVGEKSLKESLDEKRLKEIV